jgi:peptidyl-prolyl cis-trans isomerase D
MMKFLRSQSQTVLVVVLGVIGLGFLFYGNSGNLLTTGTGHISNDYGRIDGEDLTVAELTDAIRDTRNSLTIHGRAEQLRQPDAAAQVAEEAWRQLLLQHEADRLHIIISDQQLVDYIRGMKDFQKDGVYSPDLYESTMGALKNVFRGASDSSDPVASTKAIFETVIRNDLRTHEVSQALFSSVRSSASDVNAQYQKLYGPATVSFVTLDPKSYIASAQVTPAEIEAEYKAHPENPDYRTQEKRKVDYVFFLLTPEQAKLPDAQKSAAKDALGQKALDFALAFQPEPSANGDTTTAPVPNFLDEAKKEGLTPATTDFFTAETPPTGLPPSPSFNNAAFSLTKDNPISKVVELDNGVAVLHLAEIQASDLKPLDEVKADIEKKLQQTKGMQAVQTAAQTIDAQLKSMVAKGADFKTAAQSQNLKVDSLPVFVPYTAVQTAKNDRRLQTISYAAASLDPGQVSQPIPVQSDETVLILHVDSRAKADPAGLADFEVRFRQSQDEQLREYVYIDWANWKSNQPGTHRPPDLDAYGSVE